MVLADAYEYNLWFLDENGVPVITDHPLHDTTIESFLASSTEAYAGAIVEVLHRRGHDPHQRLLEKAQASGLPKTAVETFQVVLQKITEQNFQTETAI